MLPPQPGRVTRVLQVEPKGTHSQPLPTTSSEGRPWKARDTHQVRRCPGNLVEARQGKNTQNKGTEAGEDVACSQTAGLGWGGPWVAVTGFPELGLQPVV